MKGSKGITRKENWIPVALKRKWTSEQQGHFLRVRKAILKMGCEVFLPCDSHLITQGDFEVIAHNAAVVAANNIELTAEGDKP